MIREEGRKGNVNNKAYAYFTYTNCLLFVFKGLYKDVLMQICFKADEIESKD